MGSSLLGAERHLAQKLENKPLFRPNRRIEPQLGDRRIVRQRYEEFGFCVVQYLPFQFLIRAGLFLSQDSGIRDETPASQLLLSIDRGNQ
jgi:hypothetical protein